MLVFNKLAKVYGILALFTGFDLSLLLLSTYLYSIVILVALVVLVPHIRKQSPLECLLLAWVYIVDTLINTACTTFFAIQWYLASAAEAEQHDAANQPDVAGLPAVAAMVTAATRKGLEHAPRAPYVPMPHDTAFSIILITGFTLVRIYFCFVVASYAQQILLRYVDRQIESDRPCAKDMNGPFAVGSDDGEGWRGWLGRSMLSVGRTYWLGYKDQEDWTRSVSERLRKATQPPIAGAV